MKPPFIFQPLAIFLSAGFPRFALFALLCAGLVSLQGCKQEEAPVNPAEKIKGEWHVTYFYDLDTDTLTSTLSFDCNFTSDSTFTLFTKKESFNGSWAWTPGTNFSKIDVLVSGISSEPVFDVSKLDHRWLITSQTDTHIRLVIDIEDPQEKQILDLHK